MSGASSGQLRTLIGLRLRMVRSRGRRVALVLALAGVPALVGSSIAIGLSAPAVESFEVRVLLPTLFLSYAALCVVVPLAAGGGLELFPADQLVAYPVRPRTVFWSGALLTPLNIAWVSQTAVLLGAVAYGLAGSGAEWTTLLVGALWVICCTFAGLALAWLVMGLRQSRRGRLAVWAAGLATATVLLLLANAEGLVPLLDELPTRHIVGRAILRPGTQWWQLVAALAATSVAAAALGGWACSWALRRPSDRRGGPESRAWRRGRTRSAWQLLVHKDWESTRRAAPLRRGLLLLGVLPVGIGLVAEVSWTQLVLLPGLVASGAALLYGVNAYCLDGTGAVWLASLPHDPRQLLVAKAVALAAVCAVPTMLSLVAASLSTDGSPDTVHLTAIPVAALCAISVVVTRCLSLSVRRPHRADLKGPRDTPAPPGSMTLYSVDLALRTAGTGLWLLVGVATDRWWGPPLAAAPVLALCALSVSATLRRWDRPEVRASVVTTVAYG